MSIDRLHEGPRSTTAGPGLLQERSSEAGTEEPYLLAQVGDVRDHAFQSAGCARPRRTDGGPSSILQGREYAWSDWSVDCGQFCSSALGFESCRSRRQLQGSVPCDAGSRPAWSRKRATQAVASVPQVLLSGFGPLCWQCPQRSCYVSGQTKAFHDKQVVQASVAVGEEG